MKYFDFQQAHNFIYSNARLLDRCLFSALFEDGSTDPVLAALKAYQNPDGGLGNALEPDLRTPSSQPLAASFGLVILDLINRFDVPLVDNICNWLESISTPDGGVPYALPSLDGYPHSPWMHAESKEAQINPTAGICGLLLKHSFNHPWVERASNFCWATIPVFEKCSFHDVMPIITFLEHVPNNRNRAEAELDRIRVLTEKSGEVELDPAAAGYVKYPLDWAPSPDSFLRQIFNYSTITTHLQVLGKKQQADGGWPINWPALSKTAEGEWRGWITIDALMKFKAYGCF